MPETKSLKVLVIDVGGTQVKLLATGHQERRDFPSGPRMTARMMVSETRKRTKDWEYDAISIGYPGFVLRGRPVAEPHNLAHGWVGFDFSRAFQLPVKVINDAALQAYGSYEGGQMLFLGLGTGLGSCMVVNGVIEPMELAHLPYKKSTFEDYVGLRALERMGKKKWRQEVARMVATLSAALEPNDIVLGGGNVKKIKELPLGCRAGDNNNAFLGGFRLWQHTSPTEAPSRRRARVAKRNPTPRKRSASRF